MMLSTLPDAAEDVFDSEDTGIDYNYQPVKCYDKDRDCYTVEFYRTDRITEAVDEYLTVYRHPQTKKIEGFILSEVREILLKVPPSVRELVFGYNDSITVEMLVVIMAIKNLITKEHSKQYKEVISFSVETFCDEIERYDLEL